MGIEASVLAENKAAEEKKNRELFVRNQLSVEEEEALQLTEVDFDLSEKESQSQYLKIDPKKYDYCFENLVFEGGGMKGAAYVGAIRYLEELKLDKQIKRYAGTSAGAMMVAYLAVGYRADEIAEFVEPSFISSILNSNPMGVLNLLPNMLRTYGWKPTTKLYTVMGEHFAAKTGDADITFKQLYKMTGKELCICVTNVNHMVATYCHVKTTPSLPVRQAVCMSMSLPGYFQAVKITNMGETDVYVDGGLLCNYPIHCFDGWFLSMDPEDSFFEKFQPLSNISHLYDNSVRFGTVNENTLGFEVYSDYEQDLMKGKLDNRAGALAPDKPDEDTKLYKKYMTKKLKKKKAEKIHAKVVRSVDNFLRAIRKYNINQKDNVDLEELKKVFEDDEIFTAHDCKILFGKIMTAEEAFEVIDKDNNGEIEFDELLEFIQRTGICLQNCFQGYFRQEVNGLAQFVCRIQDAVLLNLKRVNMNYTDLDRTVGINTGHVNTIDFNMELADVDFLEARGYNAMKAFLRYHVVSKGLTKRSSKDKKRRSSKSKKHE
ncbi:hypothetical protein LOTGIDRAFT_238744 [Lottia gigantea]|uniref:Uncharacterized protein n=1 Tax=Lottia gigantea TaxID=225164 RepID=V4AR32_LOTGI|nr:hypothetical protein LOTGIDRAFT_238744 [Lottia gigantea]ESO99707.1 hypothetical protein LOTGIDRAFT_238744 [Lottia gigantea]